MFPQPYSLYSPPEERRRVLSAGSISLALHALFVLFLLFGPPIFTDSGPRTDREVSKLHEAAHLVAPLKEFTQKEPTVGPITKEVNAEALRARPRIQQPPSLPVPPRPAYIPPPEAAPKQALLEPPKVDVPAAKLPPAGLPEAPPAPPPKIQPEEKPKLAFEKPSEASSGAPKGIGRLAPPKATLDEAMRSAARGLGQAGSAGSPGINVPPSPGQSLQIPQLLSDPLGVDFKPYLAQLLVAVRRNWLAVLPESARFGRGARVIALVAISRDGRVRKLVLDPPSGVAALDRAAVAGISASAPFQPLPAEFKGDEIRIQLSFLYNVK